MHVKGDCLEKHSSSSSSSSSSHDENSTSGSILSIASEKKNVRGNGIANGIERNGAGSVGTDCVRIPGIDIRIGSGNADSSGGSDETSLLPLVAFPRRAVLLFEVRAA